jgi:ATP-dependent exoDNAse (exonuclease V) beta subunit
MAGMKFGTEVHALLERVSWVDEIQPDFPPTQSGLLVATLIRSPEVKDVFTRDGRVIDLVREQPIDALIDGRILSGVIDRMHIHRNASGKVVKIEIIDFKTDVVTDPDELKIRHAGQMRAYRSSIMKIHPDAEIHGYLLSVPHARLVEVS